jgi:uncharacterized membrane protein
MLMNHEVTIDIQAPSAAVWETLIDVERWPEWTQSMKRVQRLEAGPFGVGSTARVEQPRLRSMVWKVTEYDPEHSFIWAATSAGITTVGAHRVSLRADGGVRVSLANHQTGALAALLTPFIGGMTRRYLQMEADGLKQHSEQRAQMSDPTAPSAG